MGMGGNTKLLDGKKMGMGLKFQMGMGVGWEWESLKWEGFDTKNCSLTSLLQNSLLTYFLVRICATVLISLLPLFTSVVLSERLSSYISHTFY